MDSYFDGVNVVIAMMMRIYAELSDGIVNYFVCDDYDGDGDDVKTEMRLSLARHHDDGDGDDCRDHHCDDGRDNH